MALTEGKPKKPPTFQYLPKNRAKKLKRSWVENKKVKNQWKAQKKRDGLSLKPHLLSKEDADVEKTSRKAESDARTSPDYKVQGRSSGGVEQQDPPSGEAASKVSVRDLTRQAYSPRALHIHKSDPLRKRRTTLAANSENKPSHSPKGQPNMKLRMNAMLEKIKRDLC